MLNMHFVIPHCLPYKPTLLFLTGIKLLYIQSSSALSVLLEEARKALRNALHPTVPHYGKAEHNSFTSTTHSTKCSSRRSDIRLHVHCQVNYST